MNNTHNNSRDLVGKERNPVTCDNCGTTAGVELLDTWLDPDQEIEPWTCPDCRD